MTIWCSTYGNDVHVLIVEDESFLGETIHDALRREAIASHTVCDGHTALEYLAVTDRELEIIQLVGRGMSNSGVASGL